MPEVYLVSNSGGTSPSSIPGFGAPGSSPGFGNGGPGSLGNSSIGSISGGSYLYLGAIIIGLPGSAGSSLPAEVRIYI